MVVLHGYTRTYETYNFAMFSLHYVKDSNLLFCTVIIRFVISFISLLCRPNKIDLSLLCTMANQFERQIYNKKTSSVDTEKVMRCFAPATSRLGRWATKGSWHSWLNPTKICLKYNTVILNSIIQIRPSTWHWSIYSTYAVLLQSYYAAITLTTSVRPSCIHIEPSV